MGAHAIGANAAYLGIVVPFIVLAFGSLGVLWMTRQYTTVPVRTATDAAIDQVRDRLERGEITPDEYQRIAAVLRS